MANFYLTGIGSLTGALATALGFLVTASLQKSAFAAVSSQRAIVVLYAAMGIVLAAAFEKLSPAPEAHGTLPKSEGMTGLLGIGASRGIVLRLGSLFALDAFGGGFVVQSFAAYWFYLRFGVDPAMLGGIFFGANVLGGFSALVASRLASRCYQ